MAKRPFEKVQDWSRMSGLKTYVVMNKDVCVATVVIRRTGWNSANGQTVRAIVRKHEIDDVTGRRVRFDMFERKAGPGGGFDMDSAAMSCCKIGSIIIADNGQRWDDQLADAGYTVIQTL